MQWFVMCVMLSAPQVSALTQEPAVPADRPVDILPIKHIVLSFSPPPKEPSFRFRADVIGTRRTVCDPFGRTDAECSDVAVPFTELAASGSYWSLRASGGLYTGAVNGKFGEASVRAQFPRIGPVGIGAVIEITGQSWRRNVFTAGEAALGTSRSVRAGFIGLEVLAGRPDRRYISLAVLPGYWQSVYTGTLDTPGLSTGYALADDEFALVRVRLEAGNFTIGKRIQVSGNLERTALYATARRSTASAFVPVPEWAFGATTSFRVLPLSRRTALDVVVRTSMTGGGPPLLREPALGLGVAWRFR